MSPKNQTNVLELKAFFSSPAKPATTRFAPSPTGVLHLGHVAAAIHVWGLARAIGARVILRMEDHDQGRCRKTFEDSILKDLDWLGLEPHDGVSSTTQPSPYRQSDHWDRYLAAVHQLATHGHHVYACSCSRREIQAQSTTPHSDDELRYNGHCRSRQLEPKPGFGLRAQLGDETITFDDALMGEQQQTPADQCGDLLLRDRDGYWTYQAAVVADDLADGINLVIRGEDLLASTGRQIVLGQMLGRQEPAKFAHHGLILDDDGQKLSKRQQAAGIGRLRDEGNHPHRVLALAAELVGLTTNRQRVGVHELAGLFLNEW